MSIISEDNKVPNSWMAWKKPGDKIEGTLVGRGKTMNQLSGKEQTVYEVMIKGEPVVLNGEELTIDPGTVWKVGGKVAIDEQMKHVKLGQVVAFLFKETKPNPRPGMNDTKIIEVFAKSSIVDEEWLAEREMEEDAEAAVEEASNEENPVEQFERELDETAEAIDLAKVKAEIMSIAKDKLGAKEGEEVNVVMEKTGKAFIDANLPEILDELKKL